MMTKRFFPLILFFLAVFVHGQEKNFSNVSNSDTTTDVIDIEEQTEQSETNQIIFPPREVFQAKLLASSLSNAELAAQVLMTGIDGNEHLHPNMAELLQEIPAGAVMLFKYNLSGNLESIKNLLAETSSYIKEAGKNIPPFIAVDHEGGHVHRFSGNGITHLPAARSYWEKTETENDDKVLRILYADAFSSGKELAELGINMNLAPIAEIENDENALFLDTRSYGPDAEFTSAAVLAFSKGMMAANVLPVLKHFPGSSNIDPHTGIAILRQDKDELDEMILPFRRAIQNGDARAVMISHSIISALEAELNGSLSKTVIQDWLRKELGFGGVIIADDFAMQAVTSRGITSEEAIIKALNAGVNLVMTWPKNLKKTHAAIVSAVEQGTLSRETLASRVETILLEKMKILDINFGASSL